MKKRCKNIQNEVQLIIETQQKQSNRNKSELIKSTLQITSIVYFQIEEIAAYSLS